MLMRTDPFRDLERFTQQAFGPSRAVFMPMDAYRSGDKYTVHFDMPGVDVNSIDLTVEKNALTVTAERRWKASDDTQVVASERPQGKFSRQLMLGEGLDASAVEARYDDGVLTLTIPVAEQAKPRKVEIVTGGVAGSVGSGGSEGTIESSAEESAA